MFISVIIPCFNEINTLESIINKILKQRKIKKEIIIVDDGSTDGTKELIEKKIGGAIRSSLLILCLKTKNLN
jgi:glycosyltransferase involved in cell wall biosynthesis